MPPHPTKARTIPNRLRNGPKRNQCGFWGFWGFWGHRTYLPCSRLFFQRKYRVRGRGTQPPLLPSPFPLLPSHFPHTTAATVLLGGPSPALLPGMTRYSQSLPRSCSLRVAWPRPLFDLRSPLRLHSPDGCSHAGWLSRGKSAGKSARGLPPGNAEPQLGSWLARAESQPGMDQESPIPPPSFTIPSSPFRPPPSPFIIRHSSFVIPPPSSSLKPPA